MIEWAKTLDISNLLGLFVNFYGAQQFFFHLLFIFLPFFIFSSQIQKPQHTLTSTAIADLGRCGGMEGGGGDVGAPAYAGGAKKWAVPAVTGGAGDSAVDLGRCTE
jgi:hypothetical protein